MTANKTFQIEIKPPNFKRHNATQEDRTMAHYTVEPLLTDTLLKRITLLSGHLCENLQKRSLFDF